MARIPSPRLQEVLFGSADKAASAKISALEKQGLIRKIAPRIYTSNLTEDPAFIIKRNWYRILENQYPEAIVSHRSALEFKPTPTGHIYMTYTYTKNVSLPGMTIHFLKGKGPVEGDNPFFEKLYVSQDARAFLENMEPARGTGETIKVLPQAMIEEKLDNIIRTKGDHGINALRDKARLLAPVLGMEEEFKKLNLLISALLTTSPSNKLTSPVAKARILGDPFDPDRTELFEKLQQLLSSQSYPEWPDRNNKPKAYRDFAFFESYFSNYIEGTEFEIAEAKEIITTSTPIPARNEDSHDILGTYQLVSDRNEMSRVPPDDASLIQLLQERHAVLLRARLSKTPGEFKQINNRAGNTEFVDWQLVSGTLKKGFEWYSLLQHPFAKSAYMMFLISEVHPFLDGNGRIARVMMNAELTAAGLSKIIIPTVYRDDYIGALKQFTNQRTPEAYVRMLSRAWQFSSNIIGEDTDSIEDYLTRCNAFKEPKEAKLKRLQVVLATDEWSSPTLVDYGKSIYVYPTSASLSIKVFNEAGESALMLAGPGEALEIKADAIAQVYPQQVIFKSADKQTRIEYELR